MRTLNLFLLFFFLFALNSYSLPECEGDDISKWDNCFGTAFSKNGDKYVGEYKDGKYHGKGTYTWGKGPNEGDKYVGGYKDGKMHGKGTYTWANGSKYVGGYKDGGRHGQGTMTSPYSSRYVGEWKDDQRSEEHTSELQSPE